jgi:hypothetical protein
MQQYAMRLVMLGWIIFCCGVLAVMLVMLAANGPDMRALVFINIIFQFSHTALIAAVICYQRR